MHSAVRIGGVLLLVALVCGGLAGVVSADSGSPTTPTGAVDGFSEPLASNAAGSDGEVSDAGDIDTAEWPVDLEAVNRDRSVTTSASDRSASTPTSASTQGDRTIELTQELRQTPDRVGEYDAHHRYRIPDGVVRLEVTLPDDATVVSRSGFVRRGDNQYAWDGVTREPTLTYRVPADRTIDQDGPIAGPGEYLFVDRGEWALVTRPRAGHSWSWTGSHVSFDQRTTTAGEGATGDVMAFLGPHQEYRHTAHGQTFRLIAPESATLREDPEEIFDSLEHASDTLRVGDRDREVFIVAAPTGEVQWGVRGLQIGSSDMWVRDTERLDDVDNVWLHEYVHTRQDYDAADDHQWFAEGSAVYYAALLTLQQDRIEFEAFRQRLARGGESRFQGVWLADRESWRNNPDYFVGALVAAELDRQLRLATDSERSLQDSFRRMNAHDGQVDGDDFERFLRTDGGGDVERLGAQYTRTTTRPTMWNADQHGEAFGVHPARITYQLGDAETGGGYLVDGPYREGPIDGAEPIVLVPGETLTISAVVKNDGETAGSYKADFRVDGQQLDGQSGRLNAGESGELTFDREFTEPGEYTVSVGEATVQVSVREPARASVTAFEADQTEVTAGSTVTLSITVENDATWPGEVELPIVRNGEQVATETVRLDAGAQQTFELEQTVEEPGTYVFSLGEASSEQVVVTARSETMRPIPGFTVGVTIVALIAAGIAARYRNQ